MPRFKENIRRRRLVNGQCTGWRHATTKYRVPCSFLSQHSSEIGESRSNAQGGIEIHVAAEKPDGTPPEN